MTRTLWRDHGLPLLCYAALSVLISWPLARDFTTLLASDSVDARHNLWFYWHTSQVLLGHQPLYDAPLLYYPVGITLLTHAPGPLSALFALPFWPLGPVAAYNGALLVCLVLSGYCTYLLARDLGLERSAALFAGGFVLVSPMCVAGLESHPTKVFTGLIALALVGLFRVFDRRSSRLWLFAPGIALLGIALHDGYQFVYTGLLFLFFGLVALWRAPRSKRRALFLRAGLAGLAALMLTMPLLVPIMRAAQDVRIGVNVSDESKYAPDLLHFLLPPQRSLFFSAFTAHTLEHAKVLNVSPLESADSLAWIGLALMVLAWFSGRRGARRWVLATLLCVLFGLGPTIAVAGKTWSTIAPYALLMKLPGMGFMRAPGRFMVPGFITFAIAAAFGLVWLIERLPRQRNLLLLAASGLVLVQYWPLPLRQEALRPVPAFYRQIASDPEEYGVFDLPLKPAASLDMTWSTVFFSSYYQVFQLTHGKGIALGYVSRTYTQHPIFAELLTLNPALLQIDGQPAPFRTFQNVLARNNFRYVVLHKKLVPPQADGTPAPGMTSARELLAVAFAEQQPLVDDELSQVYRVHPSPGAPQLHWGENWRFIEREWRWATSPATLMVEAPVRQAALLQITPAFIHDAKGVGGLGAHGTLRVQVGSSFDALVPITVDQTASLPIPVLGTQAITLTLEAGNFQPSDYGGSDSAQLSFAIRSINLQSPASMVFPPDILVDEAAQRADADLLALYGNGWYDYEAASQGRWAASPAQISVYSASARRVTLKAVPTTLYNGRDGLGQQGTIQVAVNDGPAQTLPIQEGQPFTADLLLQAGWNNVEIALMAGNFQADALFPGSGDQRQLSFRLGTIDISTKTSAP